MEWEIAPNCRVDIAFYTGPNFSGHRTVVEVYPSGRKGELPNSTDIQSVVIAGPLGHRVVFKASVSETDWQEQTWRAIELQKGTAFKNRNGVPMLRVPDLDAQDKPNANRSDPDLEVSYTNVETLDAGTSWTYGRVARLPLKGNLRAIKIDKVPLR